MKALPGRLNEFCEDLAAEYLEVAGFVEVLSREQHALQAGEAGGLKALQPEKRERLTALTTLARNRAAALRAMGYHQGAQGIADLMTDHPEFEERLLKLWHPLEEKAWEANNLARLNAHLCATHQQHYEDRLAALEGAVAPAPALYGDDGASLNASRAPRALAQA